jgi:hypothetical protein
MIEKVDKIKQSIITSPAATTEMLNEANKIAFELEEIALIFTRNSNFPSTEENPPSPMTLNERLSVIRYTHYSSTEPVTEKEKVSYEALVEEFPVVYNRIKQISDVEITTLENKLESIGASVTPGRLPDFKMK